MEPNSRSYSTPEILNMPNATFGAVLGHVRQTVA
jgi:hypothetical protein